MDTLKINLEHCYGIKKFQYEFDLRVQNKDKGVYSIYAPNGFMKSSLARTLDDIAKGRDSQDIIFPERITIREVFADNDPIEPNDILVIKPYEESYSSKQISLLLVNDTLKEQYEKALKAIELKKSELEKALKKLSGLSGRKDSVLSLLCKSYDKEEKQLFELLSELIEQEIDFSEYAQFKYSELFNDKTLALLKSGNIKQELGDYIQIYDTLIESSPILSKTFNHQNAHNISKSLKDTGFFSAEHTVNITIEENKKEIKSHAELQKLINEEQNKILNNEELSKKFEAVDKKLGGNVDSKKFRDYLSQNKQLLPELVDYPTLQKNIWSSYILAQKELCQQLIDTYNINKTLISEIIVKANEEKTTWETVVKIFNKRFNVPFSVKVDNQEEVILHNALPTITFDFHDGRETKSVNKAQLLDVLSQGERRALYILNILFEIEIRKDHSSDMLFVIDDIADSFDYQNKYIIIQYLKELADKNSFKILFLTHNFDFHRTICSRIGIYGDKRLFTTKTPDEIILNRELYQNDVLKHWKSKLHQNIKCVLACIPFARNLAEYCGDKAEYTKLTALLHLKPETKTITISKLQEIYRQIFKDKTTLELQNIDETVYSKLLDVSEQIVNSPDEVAELEHKIILAITIRLIAEDYMIKKINDSEFVGNLKSNQTSKLFDRFITDFNDDFESIALLEQVNIMTPENIHLNSFMYEPILDMSAQQLIGLYNGVNTLLTAYEQ